MPKADRKRKSDHVTVETTAKPLTESTTMGSAGRRRLDHAVTIETEPFARPSLLGGKRKSGHVVQGANQIGGPAPSGEKRKSRRVTTEVAKPLAATPLDRKRKLDSLAAEDAMPLAESTPLEEKRKRSKKSPDTPAASSDCISGHERILASGTVPVVKGNPAARPESGGLYSRLKDRSTGWPEKIALAKQEWAARSLPHHEAIIFDCLTAALANPKKSGFALSSESNGSCQDDLTLVWSALTEFLNSERIEKGEFNVRFRHSFVASILDSLKGAIVAGADGLPLQSAQRLNALFDCVEFLLRPENTQHRHLLLNNAMALQTFLDPLLQVNSMLMMKEVAAATKLVAGDDGNSSAELLARCRTVLDAVLTAFLRLLATHHAQTANANALFTEYSERYLASIATIITCLPASERLDSLFVRKLRHLTAYCLFTSADHVALCRSYCNVASTQKRAKAFSKSELALFPSLFASLLKILTAATITKIKESVDAPEEHNFEIDVAEVCRFLVTSFQTSLVLAAKKRRLQHAPAAKNPSVEVEPGLDMLGFASKVVDVLFGIQDGRIEMQLRSIDAILCVLCGGMQAFFGQTTTARGQLFEWFSKLTERLLSLAETHSSSETIVSAALTCFQQLLDIDANSIKPCLERILSLLALVQKSSRDFGRFHKQKSFAVALIKHFSDLKQLATIVDAYVKVLASNNGSFESGKSLLGKSEMTAFADAFELLGPMQFGEILTRLSGALRQRLDAMVADATEESKGDDESGKIMVAAKCLHLAGLIRTLAEALQPLKYAKLACELTTQCLELRKLIGVLLKRLHKKQKISMACDSSCDLGVRSRQDVSFWLSCYVELGQALSAIILVKTRYASESLTAQETEQLEVWACSDEPSGSFWRDAAAQSSLRGLEGFFSLAAKVSRGDDVTASARFVIGCLEPRESHTACAYGCPSNRSALFCPVAILWDVISRQYVQVLAPFAQRGDLLHQFLLDNEAKRTEASIMSASPEMVASAETEAAAAEARRYRKKRKKLSPVERFKACALELLSTMASDNDGSRQQLLDELLDSLSAIITVEFAKEKPKLEVKTEPADDAAEKLQEAEVKVEPTNHTTAAEIRDLAVWLKQSVTSCENAELQTQKYTANLYELLASLCQRVATAASQHAATKSYLKFAGQILSPVLTAILCDFCPELFTSAPKKIAAGKSDPGLRLPVIGLNFLDAVLRSGIIHPVTPHLVGLCLTFAAATTLGVPRSLREFDAFEDVFRAMVQLLNTCLLRYDEITLRMLSTFWSLFNRLLTALLTSASSLSSTLTKTSQSESADFSQSEASNGSLLERMIDLARLLTRLCNLVAKHPKEFGKTAVYTVSVFIDGFHKAGGLPLEIRQTLMPGLYRLLDLCDRHRIALLQTNLPGGLKDIFRTMYEDYTKFYKYSGFI